MLRLRPEGLKLRTLMSHFGWKDLNPGQWLRRKKRPRYARVASAIGQMALGVVAAVAGAELVAPPLYYLLAGKVPITLLQVVVPTAVIVAVPILYVFIRMEFRALTEAGRSRIAQRREASTARALSNITRFYRAVSDIDQLIARRVSAPELFEGVCRVLTDRAETALAWVGSYDAQSGRITPTVAVGAAKAYVWERPLSIKVPSGAPGSTGAIGRAVRAGQPVIINDLMADEGMRPWHGWAREFGLASVAAFPLEQAGALTGVLVVYADKPGFFGRALKELLQSVARDIGFGLDNLARDVQLGLHAQAVENSSEAILVTDARFRLRSVNAAFHQLTGHAPEDVLGRSLQELVDEDWSASDLRDVWRTLRREGRWRSEVQIRRKGGGLRTVTVSLAKAGDDQGKRDYIVGVLSDMTERRALEGRIKYLAYHDALTGLANRHWLEQRVPELLRRRHRLAFLLLDLDHFKQVNDALGHTAGDAVLRLTGERLREWVRTRDTAVRLGGDEFMVIVHAFGPNSVHEFGQQLVDRLGRPHQYHTPKLHLSVSIGATVYPDDGTDWVELRKNLDRALSHAKESGRNRYVAFEPWMRERAEESLLWESDLRRELQSGQGLELYYQPLFAGDGKRLIGAEALLRWHHPKKGLLAAGEFIGLAQEAGMVQHLDNWVLDAAVRQLRAWEQGDVDPGVVTVNLSPAQCQDPTLPARVRRLINRADLRSPQRLAFEIVETVLVDESEMIHSVLDRLRNQGHQLILDDWGKGYARLDYLTHASIDALKIDKSFTRQLPGDERSRATVKAVVEFGHALGAEVWAEGVETQAQLNVLKRMKCDAFQGFWLGRPMPAEDFAQRVRNLRRGSSPNKSGQ